MSDVDTSIAAFNQMAEKLSLNRSNGVAGSFVIAPPGDGEPISLLVLDPDANAAVFWSLVQTKAKMALDEIATKEEQGGAFGAFGRR